MFHIIDDEKSLCELTVEILKSAGHDAIAYSNPVEYINDLYSDNYSAPVAIITDIQMPEMNGYELIAKVRAKLPEQKFVIISGYNGIDEVSKKNVCHFLPKPFTPDGFLTIMEALIKCDREGPGVVRPTCESLVEKSPANLWACPLDCLECDVKQRVKDSS